MEQSVAVVLTVDQNPHLLAETLENLSAVTHAPTEVIVVGDDIPHRIEDAPRVRVLRPQGRGRAAARNTGLRASGSRYVQFLEAGDLLTPVSIAAGLLCFDRTPEAALVYGAYRLVDECGLPIGPRRYNPVIGDPVAALLRSDLITANSTVLYRKDLLQAAGGYDETMSPWDDYDLHVRMARGGGIGSHPTVTALLRRHGTPTPTQSRRALRAALRVHRAHRPPPTDQADRLRSWRRGHRQVRDHYAQEVLDWARTTGRPRLQGILVATPLSPSLIRRLVVGRTLRFSAKALPAPLRDAAARRHPGVGSPRIGRVRLGHLDRTQPVSQDFGFDRGLPIDRYYIEQFLEIVRTDIQGRVLEVGDASYSQRFGGSRIDRQDVIHVHGGNPVATIVGDISEGGVLPESAFDCIVFTQTLHLIYDMRAAVQELHRALRPGGVLLLTVPGISQIDRGEWGDQWFWALTPAAVRRLLGDCFTEDAVSVESHGNVFAATAFLQGLALAEVDSRKLDARDAAYPVIVTARAQRLTTRDPVRRPEQESTVPGIT